MRAISENTISKVRLPTPMRQVSNLISKGIFFLLNVSYFLLEIGIKIKPNFLYCSPISADKSNNFFNRYAISNSVAD